MFFILPRVATCWFYPSRCSLLLLLFFSRWSPPTLSYFSQDGLLFFIFFPGRPPVLYTFTTATTHSLLLFTGEFPTFFFSLFSQFSLLLLYSLHGGFTLFFSCISGQLPVYEIINCYDSLYETLYQTSVISILK